MLFRTYLIDIQLVSFFDGRKAVIAVAAVAVIKPHKTVEFQLLFGTLEKEFASRYLYRIHIEFRLGHLRGHKPSPYQIIQTILIFGEIFLNFIG